LVQRWICLRRTWTGSCTGETRGGGGREGGGMRGDGVLRGGGGG
jgi:hypothetical protein